MVRCTCPSVLIALLMISTNGAEIRRQMYEGTKCYFCQNNECTKYKEPELMDCTTEKMSSKNLIGSAKKMWDILVEGSPDLDDPAKYTKCVRIQYKDYNPEIYGVNVFSYGYLSGCGPDMVDKEEYCVYVQQKIEKQTINNSFIFHDCGFCQAGEYNCYRYPLFIGEKKCYRCEYRNCDYKYIMDCTKEKMSWYSWSGRQEEMWNLLAAGGAELNDPAEYTSCVQLDWVNSEGKRSYMWGCAPDLVGKVEYCDYVKNISMANSYTLIDCNICQASVSPCVREPRQEEWRKCYMSQKREKLGPPKIMDCHNETMSLANLTGEAKNMWDLLLEENPSMNYTDENEGCFAMSWDHDSGSSFLAGCSPLHVDFDDFCYYVKNTLAKNNYSYNLFSCQTKEAEEEPRFFESWEKLRRCYVCLDADCLKPSKMINCREDELWEEGQNIIYNVYMLWASVKKTAGSDLSHYDQCFGVVWGTSRFWGCAPEYVGDKKFCDFVTKEGRRNVHCHTCTATEKPCLNSSSWETEIRKISSAAILHDYAVFWLIISLVLLKMMFLFYINIL